MARLRRRHEVRREAVYAVLKKFIVFRVVNGVQTAGAIWNLPTTVASPLGGNEATDVGNASLLAPRILDQFCFA